MGAMRIWFNGESRETRDDITIAELLNELNLSSQRVAVEVNLELVPRSQHGDRRLLAEDRLEVVTLVGGG
jgi:sulfur carrier protein